MAATVVPMPRIRTAHSTLPHPRPRNDSHSSSESLLLQVPYAGCPTDWRKLSNSSFSRLTSPGSAWLLPSFSPFPMRHPGPLALYCCCGWLCCHCWRCCCWYWCCCPRCCSHCRACHAEGVKIIFSCILKSNNMRLNFPKIFLDYQVPCFEDTSLQLHSMD